MRTTIGIPERQHALFMSLARSQGTRFGKLLIELAERALRSLASVTEAASAYALDRQTGLGVFRSGRPVTIDGVKAFEDVR